MAFISFLVCDVALERTILEWNALCETRFLINHYLIFVHDCLLSLVSDTRSFPFFFLLSFFPFNNSPVFPPYGANSASCLQRADASTDWREFTSPEGRRCYC